MQITLTRQAHQCPTSRFFPSSSTVTISELPPGLAQLSCMTHENGFLKVSPAVLRLLLDDYDLLSWFIDSWCDLPVI